MKTDTTFIKRAENFSVSQDGDHILGNLTFDEARELCLTMPGSEVREHGKNGVVDVLSHQYLVDFS